MKLKADKVKLLINGVEFAEIKESSGISDIEVDFQPSCVPKELRCNCEPLYEETLELEFESGNNSEMELEHREGCPLRTKFEITTQLKNQI